MGFVLSPEWFEETRLAVTGVELGWPASTRLVFEADGLTWHLVLDRGLVTDWGSGTVEAADLVLRWARGDAERIWARSLRGEDALGVTTVVTPDGVAGRPVPLRLDEQPELGGLVMVPGASFDVQFLFRDGPFGDVRYAMAFEDGRFVSQRAGLIDDPGAAIEVTFQAMVGVARGAFGILDALESGSVDGSMGSLALLVGILDCEAFKGAMRSAAGEHAVPLAILGELDATPAFAAAFEQAAAPLGSS